MQRGHVWHDYPWPWVSYLNMIFCNMPLDDVTGAEFENSPYTYFRPTASSVYKASAKRWQHVSNIVRRNMLRAFSHPVATCCGMMGVVVIFKLKPTTPNMSQYIPIRWSKRHAICCAPQFCKMLRWHVAIVWPGINNMYYYCSFKIFPRFWLAKTTRITHKTSCRLLNHWPRKPGDQVVLF